MLATHVSFRETNDKLVLIKNYCWRPWVFRPLDHNSSRKQGGKFGGKVPKRFRGNFRLFLCPRTEMREETREDPRWRHRPQP